MSKSKWRRLKPLATKQASQETKKAPSKPFALFGALAALIVGIGITAYAANEQLHGHITVTEGSRQTAPENAVTRDADKRSASRKFTAISPQPASDLIEKYGAAAASPAVAGAIQKAEEASGAKSAEWIAGANAAADRYEALEHGIWKPGADPMQAIMLGYVPPNMDPYQARMLYDTLPHLPKSPRPMTPEMIEQLAGGPGVPSDFDQESIRAAYQQMVESLMRQRFGPIYVPPLHRDHNRVVSQKDNQMSLIQPEYSFDGGNGPPQSIREMTDASGNVVSQYKYDPYGRQTKIGGTGPDADFGYAGMYVHQRSGLNLTPHRAYNPALGRWMSRDPIQDPTFRMMPQSPEPTDPKAGVPIPPLNAVAITPLLRDPTMFGRYILTFPGVASRTRNLNPYTYVYNNPANLSDPSGLDPYDDFGLCVAILAARLAACNNNPACMQEAWNWFWNECIPSIGCTNAPMGPAH